MTISTEEIGRWISDDRKRSVNINSGVLSDMCCEIIRNRAKIDAAEKLAEAAAPYVSIVQNADYARQLRQHDALVAALAAWEAIQ